MNLEQVQSLTDKELRIKVAELCGWVKNNTVEGMPWEQIGGYGLSVMPPDYPQDLNACQAYEIAMDTESAFLYGHKLMEILTEDKSRALISATARQRAEAFVLTMEEAL